MCKFLYSTEEFALLRVIAAILFSKDIRFCYLIVISAVSLATFVAFLMVFLLETALQEGIPLHKLEHSLVSGYFLGKNMCVWMGSWGKIIDKS